MKAEGRIALTGGIATGKSYVRPRFEALGVPTIDADRAGARRDRAGHPGLAAVVARFGTGVLEADRQVNRAALGAIVFADDGARRDLEAIIHPVVRRAIDEWYAVARPPDTPFAVAEIPLLYENGRDREFAAVIVAACDPERQVERLMARDGLDDAAARQRIAAQLPIEEKVRRAAYVVKTDGTLRGHRRAGPSPCTRALLDVVNREPASSRFAQTLPRASGVPGGRLCAWAATSVFFISIVMVSGPTPPGTGVSAPATSSTLGCTSPTSIVPFVREARPARMALAGTATPPPADR